MSNQLFEAALGIKAPWNVQGVDFDTAKRQLTIAVDFVAGSRFAYPGVAGEHPAHDTQIKRLRHLNFFQHECYLEVRVPRVHLPDGSVRLVEPDWVGQLDGFTLLFEALVLMLAQQMPFAAVARIVNLSWHRVHAICSHYVGLALDSADLSDVRKVAIDETSYRRGHEYLTLVALRNHANCALPHRGQARFLQLQPACLVSRVTHSIFKRAKNWIALIEKMGRIRCKTHGASGIAHVSVDIAAEMKAGGGKLGVLRYDIDCPQDGSASISYFVSTSVAKEFEVPIPDRELFDSKFESRYDVVFDRLTIVCGKCFAGYLKKAN